MTDTQKLLERQARWQKARKDLPWAEKIRMAERVRATILKLRVGKGGPAATPVVSASAEFP